MHEEARTRHRADTAGHQESGRARGRGAGRPRLGRVSGNSARGVPIALLCIPFGGGGAGFFRSWPRADSDAVRLVPLQLPGREERFPEPPLTVMGDAVQDLLLSAQRLIAPGDPVALFGHSLGAVIAYELARELEAQGATELVHLFVSGSPAPWNGRTERASDLADEEFLDRVAEFAGYRHAALDDPDLREVLLPLLRADVALHEDYRPAAGEPLSAPITAVRGADDGLVSRRLGEQWAAATRGPFSILELPGGHMYLAERPQRLLDAVSAILAGSTV